MKMVYFEKEEVFINLDCIESIQLHKGHYLRFNMSSQPIMIEFKTEIEAMNYAKRMANLTSLDSLLNK